MALACAVGGHLFSRDAYNEGGHVDSSAIECAVADLMALIRTTAQATDNDEYDVRIRIDWSGPRPLKILTKETLGHTFDGVSTPLHQYTPVETTVNAAESDDDFHWHVHDLAQDCVNQGGIADVLLIHPPDRQDSE